MGSGIKQRINACLTLFLKRMPDPVSDPVCGVAVGVDDLDGFVLGIVGEYTGE